MPSIRCASVLAIVFLLSSCATAERFGVGGAGGDDGETGVECEQDDDCWDGDSTTIDTCGPDGICEFFPDEGSDADTDTDTAQGTCDFDADIGQDGVFSVLPGSAMAKPSHTAPLSMGGLARIRLDSPSRLWISPRKGGRDEVVMVLLEDCANAAVNRIAWGSRIYTEELPEGEYYLAVFSSTMDAVAVENHFVRRTHCEGAQSLETGVFTDTLDGLADDFEGSCVDDTALEHRPDKVYTFRVLDQKTGDMRADLYVDPGSPRRYLYLAAGCPAKPSLEIQCDIASSQGGAQSNVESRARVSISAQDLEAGVYYLYVDTIDPDLFEDGGFELDFQLDLIGAAH